MTSSIPLRVSVDKAALDALADLLTASLPSYSYDPTTREEVGVSVSSRWPDSSAPLPARAVTVLRAGDAKEETTQPSVVGWLPIHIGVSPIPRVAAPVDLATSMVALNACRASYELHRVSLVAHQAADTVNAVAPPPATDAPSAAILADALLATLSAHFRSGAHANPDAYAALAAVHPVATQGLASVASAVLAAVRAHYPARIYLWRVADVEQPVQLDVWAADEPGRDDVMARLTDILHGSSPDRDDPASETLSLSLAGEWAPVGAEASFGAPSVQDSSDSKQRNEYRATYRGSLWLTRIVRAQSARMTRAQLLLTANGEHAATATVALVGTTTTTTIVP